MRSLANKCRWFDAPAVALSVTLLLGACVSPTDRPRDGAQPRAAGSPASSLLPAPPPTLAPAAGLRGTPTPAPTTLPPPLGAASPARSPGVYPIISNLQPAPGAAVPPGEIVIGARITGSSNLVDVVTFVNGEPVHSGWNGQPNRSTVISFVRQFPIGQHEVRIEARDEQGQTGGYRWHFSVGQRQPLPTVAAPAVQRPAAVPPRVEPSPTPR